MDSALCHWHCFRRFAAGRRGRSWAQHPTILPALAVGIGSVAAPFLLMQPGMGLGIAARRMPHPGAARLRSLVTHLLFGIGLYGAGAAMNFLR